MEARELQKLIDYLYTKWYDDTKVEKVENEIFQICKEIILDELPNDDRIIKEAGKDWSRVIGNDALKKINVNCFVQGASWMKSKIKEL